MTLPERHSEEPRKVVFQHLRQLGDDRDYAGKPDRHRELVERQRDEELGDGLRRRPVRQQRVLARLLSDLGPAAVLAGRVPVTPADVVLSRD